MQKIISRALLVVVVASSSVHAGSVPVIPEQPDMGRYKSIPEPWGDYLLKARIAERISDPLQRCLAFPDVPGNKWPKGHAEAHCRHHFAIKRPTLDEIDGMVERGEMAKLEAIFDQSLARHYSKTEFEDDIHDTFNYLLTNQRDGQKIDRITASWLRQAPNSAYANLARGAYFNGAAWEARGGKFASETPREDLRRMSELVGEAIPYFERAVTINPRLVAAYTGMIDMGRMDSRPDLELSGIRGAQKLDPACPELSNQVLRSLQPRWGGDYDQMLAYATQLSPLVAARPHLAIYLARPYADRGDRLIAADDYGKETQGILDIAVGLGSDEDALHDAGNVASRVSDGQPDHYKALAYLLQESRFREPDAWATREIAWWLVRPEPEWGLKYALRSLELEPDDALGHYLAGAGYYNTKHFEDADREYRLAIKDPVRRQDSLREVAEMWLLANVDPKSAESRKKGALRAKPYIDQLVKEYPDDGRGLIMKAMCGGILDPRIDDSDIAELRIVVKKADRSDPWQAHRVAGIETMLKQIDEFKRRPQPTHH